MTSSFCSGAANTLNGMAALITMAVMVKSADFVLVMI